jgi:hypothetical protein
MTPSIPLRPMHYMLIKEDVPMHSQIFLRRPASSAVKASLAQCETMNRRAARHCSRGRGIRSHEIPCMIRRQGPVRHPEAASAWRGAPNVCAAPSGSAALPKKRSEHHMHLLHGRIAAFAVVQTQHSPKLVSTADATATAQETRKPLLLPGLSVSGGGPLLLPGVAANPSGRSLVLRPIFLCRRGSKRA